MHQTSWTISFLGEERKIFEFKTRRNGTTDQTVASGGFSRLINAACNNRRYNGGNRVR